MVADALGRAKVQVEQLDGSAPDNKARRDALWAISGKRAVYPQVFVQVGERPAIFVSAGADDFEDLLEAGEGELEGLDFQTFLSCLKTAPRGAASGSRGMARVVGCQAVHQHRGRAHRAAQRQHLIFE